MKSWGKKIAVLIVVVVLAILLGLELFTQDRSTKAMGKDFTNRPEAKTLDTFVKAINEDDVEGICDSFYWFDFADSMTDLMTAAEDYGKLENLKYQIIDIVEWNGSGMEVMVHFEYQMGGENHSRVQSVYMDCFDGEKQTWDEDHQPQFGICRWVDFTDELDLLQTYDVYTPLQFLHTGIECNDSKSLRNAYYPDSVSTQEIEQFMEDVAYIEAIPKLEGARLLTGLDRAKVIANVGSFVFEEYYSLKVNVKYMLADTSVLHFYDTEVIIGKVGINEYYLVEAFKLPIFVDEEVQTKCEIKNNVIQNMKEAIWDEDYEAFAKCVYGSEEKCKNAYELTIAYSQGAAAWGSVGSVMEVNLLSNRDVVLKNHELDSADNIERLVICEIEVQYDEWIQTKQAEFVLVDGKWKFVSWETVDEED